MGFSYFPVKTESRHAPEGPRHTSVGKSGFPQGLREAPGIFSFSTGH
jgi:hypothetical protein